MTNIVTRMLRGNIWRRTLWWIRKSMRAHVLVFGEDPHDPGYVRNLSCSHTFRRDGALVLFSIIDKCETDSMPWQA
jgi:hypothetical protein